MEVKVVITPDNRVLAAVERGDFEAARETLERLLAELGAEGLPLVVEGGVERHHQGDDEVRTDRRVDERA